MLAVSEAGLATLRGASRSASAVPIAVIGRLTADGVLTVRDSAVRQQCRSICPSMCCWASRRACSVMCRASPAQPRRFDAGSTASEEAALRVLSHPAVADKTFLITIGDRTVGGPDQPRPDGGSLAGAGGRRRGDPQRLLPSHRRSHGDGRAHAAGADRFRCGRAHGGHRSRSPTSSRRMWPSLRDIRLSANWMAACGEPGEDAALYDAVRAVGMELCPALGIAIPVGKDSLSMKTVWREGDAAEIGRGAGVADRLGVCARGRCAAHADAACCVWMRRHASAVDRSGRGPQPSRCVDPRAGVRRAGQTNAPDLDSPALLQNFAAALRAAAAAAARAGLSRRLGRRPVRHAGGDGVRSALWPRRASCLAERADSARDACSPKKPAPSSRCAPPTCRLRCAGSSRRRALAHCTHDIGAPQRGPAAGLSRAAASA